MGGFAFGIGERELTAVHAESGRRDEFIIRNGCIAGRQMRWKPFRSKATSHSSDKKLRLLGAKMPGVSFTYSNALLGNFD